MPPLLASKTGVSDGAKPICLDWKVELALLEDLEVAAEVTLVDDEEASDVEHEEGAWRVLDVTGSAMVEAEKTEV